MKKPVHITCEYCGSGNLDTERTCLACGAVLPGVRKQKKVDRDISHQNIPDIKAGDIQEVGEDIDELYKKGLYVYSAFWRTLAEALVIALCGFAIGITAGATGLVVWGVIGATLVGFAVGWSIKMSLLTLLITPLGIVIGTLAGLIFWAFGGGAGIFVFTLTLFTVLATLIGGRRVTFRYRRFWEKLRPFLGLSGGFLFGLLGVLLGLGLEIGKKFLLGS